MSLYTLSDGTKQILEDLDEPINLYFYYSDKATENIPTLRDYANRVRELLEEFEDAAGGNILPAANAHELGGFVRAAVRPGSHLVSDDFKGYAGLHGAYRHHPVTQGEGKNAERLMPIVHVLFSNVKTWLNGTYHGVSAKHLPRYAREWNYRFNRRTGIADLADFVLQRAVAQPTITYRQLIDGLQPEGALPALSG